MRKNKSRYQSQLLNYYCNPPYCSHSNMNRTYLVKSQRHYPANKCSSRQESHKNHPLVPSELMNVENISFGNVAKLCEVWAVFSSNWTYWASDLSTVFGDPTA